MLRVAVGRAEMALIARIPEKGVVSKSYQEAVFQRI